LEIDRLIRKYGYSGTPAILDAVRNNEELNDNLGAAAHLIHGSSEGRFSITYCPGSLNRKAIESVHFKYHELSDMLKKYDPLILKEGFSTDSDGEEIFYISNPALGLWSTKQRFI
jgi:hypothetical protein